jgi:hypothetical protein
MRTKRAPTSGHRNDRYARLPKEEMGAEPSVVPMCSVSIFILVMSVVAIILRSTSYARTTTVAEVTIAHLEHDIDVVVEAARKINDTVINMQYKLLTAPDTCRVITDGMKKKVHTMSEGAVTKYTAKAEDLYEAVKPLPAQVEFAHAKLQSFYPFLKWVPLVPVIVTALISGFLVMEALLTQRCATGALAKAEDCGMRLSAGIFFVAILLVAVIATTELVVGIVASIFCRDVDDNILVYMDWALEEKSNMSNVTQLLIYHTAEHYMTGRVANPIVPKVSTLRKYAKVIHGYLHQDMVNDNKEVPSAVCPGLEGLSTGAVFGVGQQLLRNASQLMRTSNIYPYYHNVVHQAMCGSFIDTLGNIMVMQVIVGILCFPLCAILTHRFLGSWAAWKASTEEARDDFLSDMDEATGKHGDRHAGHDLEDSDSDEEDHWCFKWSRGGTSFHNNLHSGREARDGRMVAPAHDWSH